MSVLPAPPAPDDPAVLVLLGKIEGKIDVALAQQAARISLVEREVRVVEDNMNDLAVQQDDHEDRIDKIERRPAGLTWRDLWLSLTGAAGFVGVAVGILHTLGIL